jgi:hypothetical protein
MTGDWELWVMSDRRISCKPLMRQFDPSLFCFRVLNVAPAAEWNYDGDLTPPNLQLTVIR